MKKKPYSSPKFTAMGNMMKMTKGNASYCTDNSGTHTPDTQNNNSKCVD